MRIVMGIKFCVKPSLEKLKESDGFGAEIEVEINGKEFVLALCYIVQALAAILATVTFAVASCDEIPYVLEKFEEDERQVIRRNCRDGRLRVGFGTYEPMSPVVFKKEGDYLVIEAFENDRLVGRGRVKVREYVKAAVGFLEEYLKDATEDAYLTALERVKELIRNSRYASALGWNKSELEP